MQSLKEVEDWYKVTDPWGYTTNPDDIERKQRILSAIPKRNYKKALDIGCGEGWITQDLPADTIHGLELSDRAAKRFPKNVKRVLIPKGKYDLILVTGVLYEQYDYQQVMSWVASHRATDGVIVTSHIEDWEKPLPIDPSSTERFKYREYTQVLRVYR